MASIGQKLRVNGPLEQGNGATMLTDQQNLATSVLPEIEAEIEESVRAKQQFLQSCKGVLAAICIAVADRLQKGGKLLLFGNGGSAADAQHIAAEFVGRYQLERDAFPAMSLTSNTSTVTAVANDYGFQEVFARQIAAFGRSVDAAIGISTSGNSPNVIRGLAAARERGLLTVGFTGHSGGELKRVVELCLSVPSGATARIQECHILAGHILSKHCEQVLTKGLSAQGLKSTEVRS
jgi:D-sedoheptulose 7-phosphate isomerase